MGGKKKDKKKHLDEDVEKGKAGKKDKPGKKKNKKDKEAKDAKKGRDDKKHKSTPDEAQPSPAPKKGAKKAKAAKASEACNDADVFARPLGFTRIVQALFILDVIFVMSMLVFIAKSGAMFTLPCYLYILRAVLDTVALWLIRQRYAVARPCVIAFSLVDIATNVGVSIYLGTLDVVSLAFSCALDLVFILYFAFFPAVRKALVRPMRAKRTASGTKVYADEHLPRLASWAFWRNALMWLCLFAAVGHWMEAGYLSLVKYGLLPGIYDPGVWVQTDWLCPSIVYGIGAFMCILLFCPLRAFLVKKSHNAAVSALVIFVAACLVCCGVQLAAGTYFNTSWLLWDYRGMPLSFGGQVCLQNVLGLGLSASFLAWVVYPLLERFAATLPRWGANFLFVCVVLACAALFCLSPSTGLAQAVGLPELTGSLLANL